MNYTFAREVLRKCRAVTGVGSIRVWKAEFDQHMQRWRAQSSGDLASPGDLRGEEEKQRDRTKDKEFARQWNDWDKAE